MEILFSEWWGIAGLGVLLLLLIKGALMVKYLLTAPVEDEPE